MTVRMTPAADIVTRSGLPALNVKVYDLRQWPSAEHITATYAVPAPAAQHMLEQLWNIAVEDFWRDATLTAEEYLPRGAEVFSDGRSGGWLLVDGLGDVAEWTTAQRQQWTRFTNGIQQSIRYFSGRTWADETLAELVDHYREEQRAEKIRDAAPELLEALKSVLREFVPSRDVFETRAQGAAFDCARAAIAKAEG